jgi:hypothetical protein
MHSFVSLGVFSMYAYDFGILRKRAKNSEYATVPLRPWVSSLVT